MRARALTETLNKPKISIIVEQYKCHDHTVLSKIGANAQRQNWSIRAIGTGQAQELEVEQANNPSVASEDTLFTGLNDPIPHESWSASPSESSRTSTTEQQAESPAESPPQAVVSPAASPTVSHPVSLVAVVDKGVAGMKEAVLGAQVCIRADCKQLYPPSGDKAKLWEDFTQEWGFRGTVYGMGMVSPTEKWIPGTLPTDWASESGVAHRMQDAVFGESPLKSIYEVELDGKRHPAVLTRQRPDGRFEITAFQPDANGIIQQVYYPSFDRSRIFVSGTTNALDVPECSVSFTIPRANPHGATLTADGVHFKDLLGRASPKLGYEAQRITMDVPKERKPLAKNLGPMMGIGYVKEERISLNVGAAVLQHFLSGEVRIGDSGATRLSKWWTIQLGPFAEHTLKLVKKSRFDSTLTLTVDDQILAECNGVDIGSSPGTWHCKFRFVGERHMDFNVFEKTKDGVQLDTKGTVVKYYPYEHVVEVLYQHRKIDDLAAAQLTVDGVPATHLPFKSVHSEDANLHLTREVLKDLYGVEVPEKVVLQDTRSTARKLAGRVWQDFEKKNGPLDNLPLNVAISTQVVAQKAGETSAFFSKLASDVQTFLRRSQTTSSTGLSFPVAVTGADQLPALLTSTSKATKSIVSI